ncbi:aado/keto reductase [Dendrothele bispora CBS 962.96]|uniref:Aado/keto reductase n=1 Tax=Dendrothele bispora (strain CBS 962.96) TaxID=1314807 RepID=A0A4V4HCX4_DENBC|nr:aado/keto reductase [Dendrothele bispora CBS 962.96]
MAAKVPSFNLNDGTKMPSVGLGCWMGSVGDNEEVYQMCKKAIEVGYRHFDTVSLVGNEKQVGRAIRDSGIPRNEFYVVTKLPNSHHHLVKEAFDQSLGDLNCEYIDLYLMHWPQAYPPGEPFWSQTALPPDEKPTLIDCWKDMEKLLETGKVKTLGVSNFSIKILERLLPHCTVVPAVNQIECHPCLPEHELKAYCETKNILLTAWSPLGKPGHGQEISLLSDKTVKSIADKHGADVSQVLLSWGVQRKTVVIPKTVNETRMKTNISLINLDKADMDALDQLHQQPGMHRALSRIHMPDGKVFGWTYEQLGWNMTTGGIVKSN